jgi:hypothetical protein
MDSSSKAEKPIVKPGSARSQARSFEPNPKLERKPSPAVPKLVIAKEKTTPNQRYTPGKKNVSKTDLNPQGSQASEVMIGSALKPSNSNVSDESNKKNILSVSSIQKEEGVQHYEEPDNSENG